MKDLTKLEKEMKEVRNIFFFAAITIVPLCIGLAIYLLINL